MTRRAFTLIEILVVIAIILLASLVALPVVYNALSGRQVDDAARVLTGMLAGVRDTAIRFNAPRGLRLLPDPNLTQPPPGDPNQGTLQLVYSRMIPIEPAGDYREGKVNIGPMYPGGVVFNGFPPRYPIQANNTNFPYPFPNPATGIPMVLMIEESPFNGGFAWDKGVSGGGAPNPPTSWYWNIRVGDKIRIGDSGRYYTIVGPLVVSPFAPVQSGNRGNPELFVNVGAPGSPSPLLRTYYIKNDAGVQPPFAAFTPFNPEFLFVVNGEDDDLDGYVDDGWDGYNQNPPAPGFTGGDLVADDASEWEQEKWAGSQASNAVTDGAAGSGDSPSQAWMVANWQAATNDAPYSILRRPVPSQGAREVSLPRGIVIDATSWNTTGERSRLGSAIQPGSLQADILMNPSGQVIPTTIYSSPTSTGAQPFLHFWLTNTEDVYPLGTVWKDQAGNPAPNPNANQSYQLPMPGDAMGNQGGRIVPSGQGQAFYPPSGLTPPPPVLKGERRLVTLFTSSGFVVTNTIESVPPVDVGSGGTPLYMQPGEGFYVNDVSYPFYRAQLGQREARK